MRRLYDLAASRARLSRSGLQAQEIVADVIGDMLEGCLPHAPTLTLEEQLERYIWRRAQLLRRRNKRRHHVSIDDVSDSELPTVPEPEVEDGYPCAADLPEILPRLYAMLATDPQALQLLASWEQGNLGRSAARRSGMPAQSYDRARRRIMQLAGLPPVALTVISPSEAAPQPSTLAVAPPGVAPAAVTGPAPAGPQLVRSRAGRAARAARHRGSRRAILRSA